MMEEKTNISELPKPCENNDNRRMNVVNLQPTAESTLQATVTGIPSIQREKMTVIPVMALTGRKSKVFSNNLITHYCRPIQKGIRL